MREPKDIRDDQIRIIGEGGDCGPARRGVWIFIFSALGVLLVAAALLTALWPKDDEPAEVEPTLFEPAPETEPPIALGRIGKAVGTAVRGYTEIRDTLINDIPLRIFIPHNAEMSLHIGKMNKMDKSVIYAAQAADVRADNGGIVGAFVLRGEPRAWGLSKKGFCASINGKVTIGVAENSPLFEKATEQGGYFFRQYPLVCDGKVIDNEPKGKSTRRAICDRRGEIFMVESGTIESFHDFAQALADLGVEQAVYLVGSSAYGWAVDEAGMVHEFGEDNVRLGPRRMPKNTSYIVWRRK